MMAGMTTKIAVSLPDEQVEADEHGTQVGPVLGIAYSRLEHNRRARTAPAGG